MKKIILSLLLVLSGISVAQQQPTPSETGNIVYTTLNPPPPGAPFTWNGFVNYNTGGGGLDGGAIPAYNSNTGTFIFGFMPGTVNYSLAVNFALANAGTGIQVNGFKYSWQYYNQDYSRGPLSANISFTNNKGSVIESYFFGMPQTTEGWTLMSGSKNFNTPYAPASLGNLNLSISGNDDRFWAGYYGPQIRDIDVRLLYGPVPQTNTSCTAYSIDPSCIAQNAVASVTNTSPTTYTAPVTTVTETVNTSTTPTTTVAATNLSPATTNSTASQTTSTTVSTPTVTATTTTPTTSSSRTVDGTSIGLSVVARNQQREQAIAMQASQNAIQSANEVANQVTQEAQSIASQAVSNSFSVAQTASKSTTTNVEVKTTSTNTDLTFQTNTASSSLSLFASPTVAVAQRQTDNNQSNSVIQTVATQNTTVGQTTQQTQTVDTSSRTSVVQIAPTIVANEIEQKPQTTTTVAKVTETTNNATTTTQENIVQQSQSTYNLVPPQTETVTQPSVTQKASADTNQSVSVTSVIEAQTAQQTPLVSLLPPQTNSAITTNSQVVATSNDKQVQSIEPAKVQEVAQTTNTVSYSLLPPQQPVLQSVTPIVSNFSLISNQTPVATSQPVFTIVNENNTNDSQKMLLDRSSPVFQSLENKNIETQSNMVAQQGPTVNRNAQNNEAAGNVDINRMATAPAGYNEYLNMTLRDAAFYAPKEVYANQRNVDNARALRALSSDRLHQQLVNLQYERK